MKRLFDISIALFSLTLLSPLILLLMVCVRRWVGHPVLFQQLRPGIHGRPFKIIKFRTMRDTVDENGQLLPDEHRKCKFGTLLRRSSLDELPELWNVLKGDMSLVGPRPLLMEYLDRYSPEQTRRHDVRPGITGWAQINGRNAISWEEKFTLDLWYVDNQSLLLDIKILLLTAGKVLSGKGIYSPGRESVEVFRGTRRKDIS